jgi:hypothetical protein
LNEKTEEAKIRSTEKKRRTINKCKAYFEDNHACEKEIRKIAKLAEGEQIENVDMEMFCKGIKKDLLIAFIKVRDNEDITASTEHFPKLKGKMDDLEKDPTYFCLVLKAFSVQSNPVIAREDTIPTFDIDGTNPEEDNNNDTDNTTDDGPLPAIMSAKVVYCLPHCAIRKRTLRRMLRLQEMLIR